MTFIITLIAFMMERFFHWHHLRHWSWFIRYEQWLSAYLYREAAWIRLTMNVLPPLIIIGVIGYALSGWFYGLLEFIYGIVILLYCLGPDNLWVDVNHCIQTIKQKKITDAVIEVKNAFGVSLPENQNVFHREFVRTIFIAANQRIFSVMFWFVIAGPLGAVLYRLIELLSGRQELGLVDLSTKMKRLLDWLPTRLFAFFFALGGHFTEVFHHWKQGLFTDINHNEGWFADCGLFALDAMENGKLPETGEAEEAALALLDRVFVMALVLLAVIVIILI